MSLIAASELDGVKHNESLRKSRAKSRGYYQKHRVEISAAKAYVCFCGIIYTGKGSHMKARMHAEATGHTLRRGKD